MFTRSVICFPSYILAREKVISYLVCEIRQKLPTRTGSVWQATIKVLIDQKVFEELFYFFGQGSSRFNCVAEDLNHILPVGWSERAFRTSGKYVVSRGQPITVRFVNQRELHYDHSECSQCQWSIGEVEKPVLRQPNKMWLVDMNYLFVIFSKERIHQKQKEEGKLLL